MAWMGLVGVKGVLAGGFDVLAAAEFGAFACLE